jgi:hypothetical protein
MSDIKNAGKKPADGTKQTADSCNQQSGMSASCGSMRNESNIKERMDVIASCGKKVGVVDHVEGDAIKLTRNDSADGQHHFIPTGWVDHVDNHVHLKKNSMETEQGWKADAAACESCSA